MAPPRFGGWAPVIGYDFGWPHLKISAGPTSVKNLTTRLVGPIYDTPVESTIFAGTLFLALAFSLLYAQYLPLTSVKFLVWPFFLTE